MSHICDISGRKNNSSMKIEGDGFLTYEYIDRFMNLKKNIEIVNKSLACHVVYEYFRGKCGYMRQYTSHDEAVGGGDTSKVELIHSKINYTEVQSSKAFVYRQNNVTISEELKIALVYMLRDQQVKVKFKSKH